MGQYLRSLARTGAVLAVGALASVVLPAAQAAPAATTVWLHDDAYVSAGKANVYIDVQCDRPGTDWELTVRLTAVKAGQPTATGSATVSRLSCTSVSQQVPVLVKPDRTPFFRTGSALNSGVAELRRAGATEPAATSTRRMTFYLWD